ncbi:hypothetical protein K227x_10180 [Rubripirellula lacrimiformis]|uniref:Uncharacterized protein n=1 Tax=Rubripirellula lacrimiformis TaxID=1930273 RepID=A0A517N670_9BACT|nr:hypothetical protein K227x_10180 [Rubripirellula lacrimiformis]
MAANSEAAKASGSAAAERKIAGRPERFHGNPASPATSYLMGINGTVNQYLGV